MEKSPALLFFSGQKTKLRAQFRFLFVHLPEKPVSMKRSRRSTWLPAALALYLTVSYVWLYVNGSIPLDARSVALVGLSYALVACLWWVNPNNTTIMKKWTILMLLFVVAASASAQFEKRTKYIGASLSGLGLSYSSNERFRMGLDLEGGYFLGDCFLLKGNIGYEPPVIISARTASSWAPVRNTTTSPKATTTS